MLSFPKLLIMKELAKSYPMSFSELKHKTKLTSGNLFSHCKALEDSNYIVKITKFDETGKNTVIEITDHGKSEFKSYLEVLNEFLTKTLIALENPEFYSHLPPSLFIEVADPEGNKFSIAEFD